MSNICIVSNSFTSNNLNRGKPLCVHSTLLKSPASWTRRGKGRRSSPLRRVDNLIFRRLNQFSRANGVEQTTPMHGWIIEYLYRHRDEPVFQRDIEREFSITRSTVTNILQLMERKGYIQRLSVPQDARLKQLVLTEEGIQRHEKTLLSFHQTDDYVAGLLTEEENAELLRLLNKLREALK